MKRLLLLFSVLTTFISVTWAQIPEGYYQVYGGSMSHIFSWTPEYAQPGDVVTVTRIQSGNQILKVKKVSGELNNVYDPITVTKVEGDVETYTFVMPQFDENDDYVEISGVMLQPFAILSNDHKTLTFMGIDTDDADPFANITGSHLQYYDYSSAQQGQEGLDASVMDFVNYCHNEVETVVLDPSLSATSSMNFTYVRLFYNFSKLTTIVGLEDMNMQQARATTEMFAGCSSLTSLIIGSNFYVPEKGTTPYGDEFVFDASDMFKGCDGLKNGTLTVKGTTPPVIEQYIFTCFTQGALMTEPIDLLDYSVTRDNMGNVYYWGGMFTKFNSTDEPYVSLSSDGTILTFINGEKPTTGQVWDLTAAWSTATNGSVTTVAFDESFKNVPITSCEGWFSGFTKLTTVDARFLNLGRCSSTKEMFADCSSLNDLTIGENFFIGQADTYNTTDMFKGCTAMASGTVTIVNTSPASGMYPIINQDIFSVITNGTLMTGNGVDLSTYVEEKDDGFRCLGGIFTTYNDKQILTIRLADPTKAASKDNPYIINNVDDMVILSKAVNAGEDWTKNTWIKIATANEIFDFDGITEFEPIGTSTNKFTSSFDGNGVTIKNLNLTGTTYTGVFGYASGGWTHTIENIHIDKSSSFSSNNTYLGSLAGYAEGITITNCHNNGATVTASGTASEVGGLIGYMLSGTISDCSSNANVSGYTDVGGLMGHAGYGNGKVEMYNNTVGMALAKDETISITATAGAVGAIVGSVNTCSGTGNYYNGQAITAKQGAKELTGYGFGVNLADNSYILSATGGLFAAVNPGHTGKTLTWNYDLYTKTFTIVGDPDAGYVITSATVNYTDADGKSQTISRNEEEITASRSFEVPFHPTEATTTYYAVLRPADMTKAISVDNPYLIHNVQDMMTLSKYSNLGSEWTSGWFKVADENAEFDFEGIDDFKPIGRNGNYPIRIDGNGVTIKNLKVTAETYCGLFNYILNPVVKNITIDGSCSFTATGTNSYAGSIIAVMNGGGEIANCHNNGAAVSAQKNAGGLIGYINQGNIYNNTVGINMEKDATTTISATTSAGAIAGSIDRKNNISFSNNWYSGQNVIVKVENKEYTKFGYAVNAADRDGAKSATGGLFAAVNPGHTGKTLTWSYDLSTKTFTITGAPDPGYELTSVTVSYKDANGDVQKLVRSKEELDNSRTFEVQNYPTNVEAICETALKLADPTQPASKDNPYLINNVNDMVTLSKAVNANQSFTKNTWFKVAKENDVFDFDGITDFEPIGKATNNNTKFTSRFDGNGVTIKNLNLTGNEYVGLFGCAYYTPTTYNIKSEISNIIIDSSCSFTANTNYAGAIVAITNYTDIINCHNMGATVIATASYAGGIVAQAGAGSIISGCTSKANVTSNWYAGGIAGLVSYATMTNNLVGMGLEEGETITISSSNEGGAIVSHIIEVTGSENYYNGMAVILNSKNTTYQGQGYAYWRSDNDFLKSATGGYCGVTSENSGNNVEWKYDLYTKDFTVFGTGGTADYTTSMAPSIVKDEIETLTISEGVTGIGAKAFSGCTNLNTVIFDGCTLTSAASDAFDGCTAMAEGTVIINKAIPIGDGVGTDFLSIVTNGSLKCDATSNLKAEVERQGDTFLWKGGTFGTYQQELTIADINFGENKFWTTYYSDENITTPDGVTAFVVSDIEDNTVTVSSIDYIPANVGVLLYSETSGSIQKSYLFTGSEQNYNSMLEGSLDGMTLTKEAGYILLKNEFVLTSGGQLAAHRCYLPIAKRSNKILARVMSIGWGSQTGTTDIENINSDDKTTDDHWYTLDGRKLDKAPVRKGLYIHGRRKVIVK